MKIDRSAFGVRRLGFGVPYVVSDIAFQILPYAGRIKLPDESRSFCQRQWEATGAERWLPNAKRQTPDG
jgi:hypothetical protein